MTASGPAGSRDLRALARMVSAYRNDLPPEGLPLSLLQELKDQIGCDEICLDGFDSGRQTSWFNQTVRDDTGRWQQEMSVLHWQHYWDCAPCSYPDRTGDLSTVVTIEDFYSARQWHGVGMYADVYRPQGIEHELMLTLPTGSARARGPGRTLRLFFFRGPGKGFREDDRALLTLLRPHLYQAYQDAEQRRHPVPELTARQWELLDLVAAGHTNAQIARRLGVSEGTVRTHLEHIYRRLQVSSRTAAVARAFPNRHD
jgi:DNA-binding CsgD family transcriptional regulator